MEKATSCLILLVIIVLELGWLCEGCLKGESIALLRIKNSSSFPSDGMASNWGSTEDCCSWVGISCDTTTWHVMAISLANYDQYLVSPNFYLNASLFLPFQNLKALSLEGNGIAGCLKNEGFEKLSGLANLEILDLSRNAFNVSVLASLAGLSSIKLLYLSYNKLNGSIDSTGGGNNNILSIFKGLPSLKLLDLCDNPLFHGSVDMKELDGLSNLESLCLGGNIDRLAFSKDIMSLQNLSALTLKGYNSNDTAIKIESLGYIKTLSMDVNNLDAIILSQDESETKSLERLGLYCHGGSSSSNFLETIGSLTSLKTLDISNCGILDKLPSRRGLCELRNLQSLSMGNNDLSGTLPWCLANMTSLQLLDLSYNRFTGDISASPLKALTSIQSLYISENLFEIPISLLPFYNLSNLLDLDAGNNHIMAQPESHLDDDLGPKFQLNKLSLSGKKYNGPFPKFLYHQVDLEEVQLSNLKLKGGFPNWLLENNTGLTSLSLSDASLSGPFLLPNQSHTNISDLDVWGNYFDGHIPTQIGEKLPNLEYLDLSRNGFNGRIPSSLGDLNFLYSLDLSHNALSGGIPEHLAKVCSRLTHLMLSHNRLEGEIFSEKNNLTGLRTLDLSNNRLSGNLSSASFSRASTLERVYLSTNKLEGSLGDAFYGCINLMILDLSHNCLTGTIPKWYDKFARLNFLLLSHNNLKGEIPLQLCNLDELSLIDLSDNKLSGQVPPCLNVSSTSYRQRTSHVPVPLSGFQPIEFTTKGNSYPFEGIILSYICGIDLSSNNLRGAIPPLIGYLEMIQVLNLSRNNLIGPIPISLSNLKDIESLDLSHNRLNGKIPPELVGLTFLSTFNVAHNNLSGRLPNMVSQFATFNASSYEENPFLCGLPLPRSCSDGITSPPPTASPKDDDDDWGIDMEAFYPTFAVAYIMVLLGIAAVLHINPRWRRVCFYFIEVRIANCYYFLVDSLPITNRLRSLLFYKRDSLFAGQEQSLVQYGSSMSGTLYVETALLVMCYGVQFSIMIPTVSELFGLKYFGIFYNVMSMGSPLGAFLFSGLLAGYVYDSEAAKQRGLNMLLNSSISCMGPNCFRLTFLVLAGVCGVGSLLSIILSIRIRPVYQMLYAGGSFRLLPQASDH